MRAPRMTEQQLRQSKVAGINQHVFEKKKEKNKKPIKQEDCPQVKWMWGQLAWWAIKENILVVREYRFHEERRWRFDFAVPDFKIAVEFEGVFSENSRHTNKIGYSKDTDKYREAAKMGWIILRYTTVNYKNLMKDVKELLNRMALSKRL